MNDQTSMFPESVECCSHTFGLHLDGRCTYGNCPCVGFDNTPNYGERFDGSEYVPENDDARLTGQLQKVYELMRDGKWRTVEQIKEATGVMADGTVSKHLRHLRYERFGSYLVDKRKIGDPKNGLWEYRVGAKGEGTPKSRNNDENNTASKIMRMYRHAISERDRYRNAMRVIGELPWCETCAPGYNAIVSEVLDGEA